MKNQKNILAGIKVGMVGPSRVGKTSLIASILKSGNELFRGSKVRLDTADSKTKAILEEHETSLRGSLNARTFTPGAVEGTQEITEFKLRLMLDNRTEGMDIHVMDFPGGLMTTESRRRTDGEDRWAEVQEHINHSQVLIIPVEAAIIMEASLPKHKQVVPQILSIAGVTEVARNWARSHAAAGRPALVLICPVKCESYFDDNGGRSDKSQALYDAIVGTYYKDAIKAIREETDYSNQIQIVYMPVDTIGDVELIDTQWDLKAPTFDAIFRVRGAGIGEYRPKGGDTALIHIAKLILEIGDFQVRKVQQDLTKKVGRLSRQIEDENLQELLYFLTGGAYKSDTRKSRESTEAARREAVERSAALKRALEDLQSKPYSRRPRIL